MHARGSGSRSCDASPKGEPLALETLASDTGWPIGTIRVELEGHGDIDYDEAGRIIGNGITLRPTQHRFEVDGRQLYAWCALDTLPSTREPPSCRSVTPNATAAS